MISHCDQLVFDQLNNQCYPLVYGGKDTVLIKLTESWAYLCTQPCLWPWTCCGWFHVLFHPTADLDWRTSTQREEHRDHSVLIKTWMEFNRTEEQLAVWWFGYPGKSVCRCVCGLSLVWLMNSPPPVNSWSAACTESSETRQSWRSGGESAPYSWPADVLWPSLWSTPLSPSHLYGTNTYQGQERASLFVYCVWVCVGIDVCQCVCVFVFKPLTDLCGLVLMSGK